ncbi:hypothetical protein [Pseudomonas sp. NPDC096925]|uniref:hypothetical protein n=1 Tax=Pseudomonas sp. NPDC096925 TaxID=3364484 RepID=UPI00383AB832
MTKATDYGKDLWMLLSPTFDEATRLDGFSGFREKGQAYTGFIAAAAGTMCRDVGTDAARAVLEAVIQGLPEVERNSLRVVKP